MTGHSRGHARNRSGHSRRQASVDYPRYPPENSTTQQPPAPQAPGYYQQPQYYLLPQQPSYPVVLQQDLMHDPIISEYESDNPIDLQPEQQYQTIPPTLDRTIEQLNLAVLQKINPSVTAILSIAPYATLYDFVSTPEPGWQKSGVVGTLFICQLSPGVYGEERYDAIVLNRNGLENFEAQLLQSGDGGVEVMGEYVIISQKEANDTKVSGIFIYSEGEGTSTAQAQAANAELMKQLAIAAGQSFTYAKELYEEAVRRQKQQAQAVSMNPGYGPSGQLDLLALLQGR